MLRATEIRDQLPTQMGSVEPKRVVFVANDHRAMRRPHIALGILGRSRLFGDLEKAVRLFRAPFHSQQLCSYAMLVVENCRHRLKFEREFSNPWFGASG